MTGPEKSVSDLLAVKAARKKPTQDFGRVQKARAARVWAQDKHAAWFHGGSNFWIPNSLPRWKWLHLSLNHFHGGSNFAFQAAPPMGKKKSAVLTADISILLKFQFNKK